MTRVKSGYFGHQDPVVRSSIKFNHGLSVNQSFNSHSPKMGTITREKSKKKSTVSNDEIFHCRFEYKYQRDKLLSFSELTLTFFEKYTNKHVCV